VEQRQQVQLWYSVLCRSVAFPVNDLWCWEHGGGVFLSITSVANHYSTVLLTWRGLGHDGLPLGVGVNHFPLGLVFCEGIPMSLVTASP